MTIAVVLQLVPLTDHRHYGTLLIASLAMTLVADTCFGFIIWKGTVVWKVAAVVLMLPTLFIVADFIRRAPGTF
jgi:hypothetical protein